MSLLVSDSSVTLTNIMMGVFFAGVSLWLANIFLPQLLIKKMSARMSAFGIQFSRTVLWVMSPITCLMHSIVGEMDTHRQDADGTDKAAAFEEEIRTLIDEGERKGIFQKDEGYLFQSLVEFSDTVVREVMTPRLDIVAIEDDTPISELIQRILDKGYTRIPVYNDRIDNIVGIVFAKDLLVHWGKSESDVKLEELLRAVYFIPETKKITQLLKEFQKNKNHMAIVVDEYGGVSGLVTIEDLLEEIVGEIRDEYDNEVDFMQILEDKSLQVDARLSVEDLEEYFKLTIPREDFDTVGGLIFHILGRVPKEGEEIFFNDLVMKILKAEERRVRSIHIKYQKNSETMPNDSEQ